MFGPLSGDNRPSRSLERISRRALVTKTKRFGSASALGRGPGLKSIEGSGSLFQKHVEALVRAWNEGDLDGLDAYVSDHMRRRGPASLNSDASGLAELKRVIRDFRTAFPDAHVFIEEMYYQGDRSFGRWTFEGTHTGPGDFSPTGKHIKISGSSFGRYEGGQLIEEIANFDALDMMTQLGIIRVPTVIGESAP